MEQSVGGDKKGPVGSHKRHALKNLDSPAKSDVGQLKKDGIEKSNEDPAPAAKKHCEEPWKMNSNLGADVAASHPKPQTKRATHPLQAINEASPLGTQFRLPSPKEPTESLSSMSQKSTGETLIANHSMGQRTQDGASSLDCVNQTSETETEALAVALMSPEYELLVEQLGNLQTAKQSGTFASQVAVSVDALFKCFDRERNKDLSAIQSHQVKAVDKMNNMQEALQSQIHDLDAHFQALVDQKLSKLSSVLNEVKICQDELDKFKHLLRSLNSHI